MHTSFQRQHIQQIRERVDFAHFVQVQDNGQTYGYDIDRTSVDYVGPVLVLFYTRDRVLHAHNIGPHTLLEAVTSN